MFVVMKVQDFEFETKGWKPPYPITFDMGKIKGYLPVYDTREDAEKDFPNATILEAASVK